MNFDQWLAAAQQRQPALDEEAQEVFMDICDALRGPRLMRVEPDIVTAAYWEIRRDNEFSGLAHLTPVRPR